MFRLSVVLVAAVWQQPSYEDALREASRLVEQQRFEEALASAEGLVASEPGRPEGYFLLGDLYRRQWRPSEAVEVFSHGLDKADGQGGDLHREIAVTYAEVHAWDRALEHVEHALSSQPDHPPSLYVKAMVLSQTGRQSEALRVYHALSANEPDNASFHFRIGEVHDSVNRMEEAEAAYRRALELDPTTRGARFRLGKMLVATGQVKEAERQLARAVRLAPDHAESHLELALTLDGLERATKARYHFEKALELDPSLANAYLGYGNFAARHGERERGAELLAKFQELTAVEQQVADLMGQRQTRELPHRARSVSARAPNGSAISARPSRRGPPLLARRPRLRRVGTARGRASHARARRGRLSRLPRGEARTRRPHPMTKLLPAIAAFVATLAVIPSRALRPHRSRATARRSSSPSLHRRRPRSCTLSSPGPPTSP